MARQTAWVLALTLTCAPAAAAAHGQMPGRAEKAQGPGRAEKAQGPGKDNGKDKDKPQGTLQAGAPNAATDRERWKWWLYDKAELGITDKQSAEINQIFEATIPKLRESRQEQDRAEEELSRTIKEHKADLATISMLVDRAENARSQNNKMRTLMLYRISLLLNPDQRTKLEALRARQEAARRENREPPRRYLP